MTAIRYFVLAGALAVAASAAGCGREPSPLQPIPDATAPVQTDSSRIRWQSVAGMYLKATIPFTFTNQAPDTVYVVTCGTHVLPDLQRRDGATWTRVYSVIVPPCLTVIPIPPGVRWRDSLQVCYALNPAQSVCGPWAVEGGPDATYRLMVAHAVFHFRAAGATGDSVPEAFRRSNGFVLAR